MKVGREGSGPFSFLGFIAGGRGEAYNNVWRCDNNGWPSVFLRLYHQKQESAIGSQIFVIWRTGSFLPPWFQQKLLQEQGAQLSVSHVARGGRWVGYQAKELKFTASDLPVFCWKVQYFHWTPEFHNSYIRKILPVQMLFRWGDRFWCFLFPHLPRILILKGF